MTHKNRKSEYGIFSYSCETKIAETFEAESFSCILNVLHGGNREK
jgi:hypothetical protein